MTSNSQWEENEIGAASCNLLSDAEKCIENPKRILNAKNGVRLN